MINYLEILCFDYNIYKAMNKKKYNSFKIPDLRP